MQIAPLTVRLVSTTSFVPPDDVPWETDADGAQALMEFAGRACYQSWDKPNPRTATNAGYLRHLFAVGNWSVLEHASAGFYITGISRSCSHELIRHRHFSFSQLSQRSVSERDAQMVLPPAVEADPALRAMFASATDASRAAYDELLTALEATAGPDSPAVVAGKQARQAARAVLPNAVETRLVMTGNFRSWRHFVSMRATEHADLEIRRLAVECLRTLQRTAPAVFADFDIETLADGSEVARSSYPGE